MIVVLSGGTVSAAGVVVELVVSVPAAVGLQKVVFDGSVVVDSVQELCFGLEWN